MLVVSWREDEIKAIVRANGVGRGGKKQIKSFFFLFDCMSAFCSWHMVHDMFGGNDIPKDLSCIMSLSMTGERLWRQIAPRLCIMSGEIPKASTKGAKVIPHTRWIAEHWKHLNVIELLNIHQEDVVL